ncbi:MAG: hypothetical protein JWO71_2397 [Candidatus Acidoferrum typicum]|nr:hypothetical protein [Candidatus Acidoferrum typicum]
MGQESEFFNWFAAGSYTRFSVDFASAFHSGDKRDVRDSRWENSAANSEDFAADAHGFGKIASDMREGGEKEVSEVVADKTAAGMEPILKQPAQQSLIC